MKHRGLTLAEVVISTAIFLGLSLLVVVIMRVGQRSETKADVHSQADRAVLVGMAKIRAELLGGFVYNAIPATAGQPGVLEYYYVKPNQPSIDFTGHPTYHGPVTITREETRLLRREAVPVEGTDDEVTYEVQQLEDLGSGGEVSFQWVSSRLLKISLSATRPDPTNQDKLVRYEQELKMYVSNQP